MRDDAGDEKGERIPENFTFNLRESNFFAIFST